MTVAEKQDLWDKFFDFRSVCRANRRFNYSLTTDGVTACVQLNVINPRNTVQVHDKDEESDPFEKKKNHSLITTLMRMKYSNQWYQTVIGYDPGFNSQLQSFVATLQAAMKKIFSYLGAHTASAPVCIKGEQNKKNGHMNLKIN